MYAWFLATVNTVWKRLSLYLPPTFQRFGILSPSRTVPPMKRVRSSQPLVKALTSLGLGWCWKSFYSRCTLFLLLWPPHNDHFVFILSFFSPYAISTRTLQIFNRMRILVCSSREIQSVCFRFTYSYIIRRHFAITAWPPGAFWLDLKSSCTGPEERSTVDTLGRPVGICRGGSSRDTAGRCGRGGSATDHLTWYSSAIYVEWTPCLYLWAGGYNSLYLAFLC